MSDIKHRKTGPGRRREWEIKEEDYKQVEALAGRGLTVQQMCDYFCISDATWKRRCKENPRLRETWYKGKAKQIVHVSGKLIEQINGGSVPATIFYLKTQAGWRENDPQESKEPDAPQNLTINVNDPIEAAKAYQQFMRKNKS